MPNEVEQGDNASRRIGMGKRKSAKEQFALNLHQALLAANMTQSELGRASGLGRDAISRYVRKMNLPTEANLESIAKALRVSPTSLIPDYAEALTEMTDDLPLEIKAHPLDPTMVVIRVRRTIKTSALPALLQAIEAAEAVE
jgi:transcriptional regulator with XRE-family HTH domain